MRSEFIWPHSCALINKKSPQILCCSSLYTEHQCRVTEFPTQRHHRLFAMHVALDKCTREAVSKKTCQTCCLSCQALALVFFARKRHMQLFNRSSFPCSRKIHSVAFAWWHVRCNRSSCRCTSLCMVNVRCEGTQACGRPRRSIMRWAARLAWTDAAGADPAAVPCPSGLRQGSTALSLRRFECVALPPGAQVPHIAERGLHRAKARRMLAQYGVRDASNVRGLAA